MNILIDWTIKGISLAAILVFALFMANNAPAAELKMCETVGDMHQIQVGTPVSKKTTGLTAEFKKLIKLKYPATCKLIHQKYSNKQGNYITVTTFDDDCDGGNYVGYVTDHSNKPIALIHDQDLHCIE